MLRALLPCLALIASDGTAAQAQTVTPDLFSPVPRRLCRAAEFPAAQDRQCHHRPLTPPTTRGCATRTSRRRRGSAQIPTYGLPAANGATDSGFDSLNRTRKKPKLYPGQAKPKPSPGPGSPAPVAAPPIGNRRAAAAVDPAVADRQQDAAAACDGRHR